MLNSPRLIRTVKNLKQEIQAEPTKDYPVGHVRYAVVTGTTGNKYNIQFAGDAGSIKASRIAGPTVANNGEKVLVLQYGTDEGDEFVVIGKLA